MSDATPRYECFYCHLPIERGDRCSCGRGWLVVEVPRSSESDDPAWTPLIDVSAVPIRDLIGQTDTVFARALRQVLTDLDDPDGVISAFQSFVATT